MKASRISGYSLLEVLVAFAVMALVLAALLPGQGRLVLRSLDAERRTLAEDYAYSVLSESTLSGKLAPGTDQRTYRDWQVEIKISRLATGPTEPGLLEVTVLVKEEGGTIIGRAVGVAAP